MLLHLTLPPSKFYSVPYPLTKRIPLWASGSDGPPRTPVTPPTLTLEISLINRSISPIFDPRNPPKIGRDPRNPPTPPPGGVAGGYGGGSEPLLWAPTFHQDSDAKSKN